MDEFPQDDCKNAHLHKASALHALDRHEVRRTRSLTPIDCLLTVVLIPNLSG
eukprot:COSAG06_NODE_1991_length_7895_cov_3.685736_4_plen_52_part_00